MLERVSSSDGWRRRLYLPCYKVGEAARYARASAQTVGRWHKQDVKTPLLTDRPARAELSYLQLIEVAVVAAMRAEGIKIAEIREAREYCKKTLESEYPFAQHQFQTDGKELLLDFEQIDKKSGKGKFIFAGRGGQLGWKGIIGERLKEFDFANGGVATRWRLTGLSKKVVIDPQISFGAPNVSGIAVWAIADRYRAMESVPDIADDLDLHQNDVIEALRFEGIQPDLGRKSFCLN